MAKRVTRPRYAQVHRVVVLATLAWTTSLSTAVVASGIAMVLAGSVVARWPETGFEPAVADHRWRDSASVLRGGLAVARLSSSAVALTGSAALLACAGLLVASTRE